MSVEPWIGDEFRHSESFHKLLPLMWHDGYEEILTSLLTGVYARRTTMWMKRSVARRAISVAQHRNHWNIHLVHVKISVEQRSVQILPLSGSLAVQQREANC